MVITREYRNKRTYFTLNGKPIGYRALLNQVGKLLSGYGIDAMFERLVKTGECRIDLDNLPLYATLHEEKE